METLSILLLQTYDLSEVSIVQLWFFIFLTALALFTLLFVSKDLLSDFFLTGITINLLLIHNNITAIKFFIYNSEQIAFVKFLLFKKQGAEIIEFQPLVFSSI